MNAWSHCTSLADMKSLCAQKELPEYEVELFSWILSIYPILSHTCTDFLFYRESKRKTAAVVSIRNGDRLFGDPALNAVRKPCCVYTWWYSDKVMH